MLALGVASAPVALEVCQIACESTAMPAGHASCHEHGGAPRLSPATVPCAHSMEATPSLVAAKNSDGAVSLPAVMPSVPSIATRAAHDAAPVRQLAWSHPLAVPLAIPLRV